MKIPGWIQINRHSFKIRIILIFSIITFILVGIFSRTGYFYIKKIYLDQLTEQVVLLTKLIAGDIKTDFLDYIYSSENMAMSATRYYQNYLAERVNQTDITNAFIFNKDLSVIVHSQDEIEKGEKYPSLLLNRNEIQQFKTGEAITSLPFKGKDNNYYMWCFFRLNNNYWLGIRENAKHLEKIEEISKIFWFIGLAGIMVTILAGWFLSYSITSPINKLVSFSKKIGEGNYSEVLPENIKGELEILVNALDKMRTNIKQNQREKEQMLAQIAHEIRNPLGGIELMTGLIKEDMLKHGLDVKYSKKILDEVSVLKRQITTYLNYSRPVQTFPEIVDIKAIIQEVLSLVEYKKRNIDINLDINETEIKIDPNHLKQILTNLLVNSISVLDNNGKISISTYKVDNKFCLQITDNGPGITSENIENIFQPFFTTKEDGTGLGLSISKKLCEQNGFEISVENNKECGCSFIITSIKKE